MFIQTKAKMMCFLLQPIFRRRLSLLHDPIQLFSVSGRAEDTKQDYKKSLLVIQVLDFFVSITNK